MSKTIVTPRRYRNTIAPPVRYALVEQARTEQWGEITDEVVIPAGSRLHPAEDAAAAAGDRLLVSFENGTEIALRLPELDPPSRDTRNNYVELSPAPAAPTPAMAAPEPRHGGGRGPGIDPGQFGD